MVCYSVNFFYISYISIFLPKGNFLQSAALYPHFSESKSVRSKECKQKIFAAQTPQRKRGLFSTQLTIADTIQYTSKIFYLRSQMLRTARYWVLYRVLPLRKQGYFFIWFYRQQDKPFRPACLLEVDK